MRSSRFPGKVLAQMNGRPLLGHVIDRARAVFDDRSIVVATSVDSSDDAVHAFAEAAGVRAFRGPLDDVFERFRLCAAAAATPWAVRINADSPLLSPRVLRAVASAAGHEYDLVTTIAPRTLPKGQNPEMIRTAVLERTDAALLTPDDREHVTAYYYRHADRSSCARGREPQRRYSRGSGPSGDALRRRRGQSSAG